MGIINIDNNVLKAKDCVVGFEEDYLEVYEKLRMIQELKERIKLGTGKNV